MSAYDNDPRVTRDFLGAGLRVDLGESSRHGKVEFCENGSFATWIFDPTIDGLGEVRRFSSADEAIRFLIGDPR